MSSSGWASFKRGREALSAFLKAAMGPDVGLLWVELLPQGLSQRRDDAGATANGSAGAINGWKSANGLPQHSKGPGDNVVEVFQRTGNLVGAGGHVYYESLRGGTRGAGRKECFVSLADQVG